MGVPKFYRWISERYPCLSEVVKEYQIPPFDNLYLDMNGIIHNCSHPNDNDPHFRITEEQITLDIFRYIEFLFKIIKPSKVFYMAIDGVAPRAKMNQQRGRRFRTAKDAELQELEAKNRGEELPTEARFDSNCITPGTRFMAVLQDKLRYFVSNKISTDKLWQGVKVYLSGHEAPGEGEHKIMDFIRFQKSQPNYNHNTTHCLYGLDADLIMLGLCSHEPHFSLLREEVKFNSKKAMVKKVVPEEITFHLLHLSLMRDYIELEFSALKGKLPFEFDLEKVIDDWVLLGFLIGNDFIPNIPNLHVKNDALPLLYQTYIDVMPTLDGYINESGQLNLQRFEMFAKKLSHLDKSNFSDTYADLKYFASKTSRNQNFGMARDIREVEEEEIDEESTETSSNDEDDDEGDLEELEFLQHKSNYYRNKLGYDDVTPEVLQSQAYGYVKAIQWNLHYYYNGIASWSWYYPHHYAPFISDIKDLANADLSFDMAKPFLPFQQLLGVLPAASKSLLPVAYQELMTKEDSPLIRFFPVDFETDLNGKNQEWEAVVLIPFIEEKLLVDCTLQVADRLIEEERKRNSHGPHLLFTYAKEDLGLMAGYSAKLPDIIHNYAHCEEIEPDHFRLPRCEIVKGLLKNVNLDVCFFGFPTLKHIPHELKIEKGKVRVFEQVTHKSSLMLILPNRAIDDIEAFSRDLLGKSIYVEWPYLTEAIVKNVSTPEVKFFFQKDGSIGKKEMTKVEKGMWEKDSQYIAENLAVRKGILLKERRVMIGVTTLSGFSYICTDDGKVAKKKLWASKISSHMLQATVRDVKVHEPEAEEINQVDVLFAPGSKCFMIKDEFYGCLAEIVDYSKITNKLKIKCHVKVEPDLRNIKAKHQQESSRIYHNGFNLAKKLGIHGHMLSRITGSLFIQRDEKIGKPVNIGLNLKFNKKNKEVPGYTKRTADATWLYTQAVADIIAEYLTKFPELFDRLNQIRNQDNIHYKKLFDSEEELKELLAWLKTLPCASAEHQSCGGNYLEDEEVISLEKYIQEFQASHVHDYKIPTLQTNPNNLYCPQISTIADVQQSRHDLYDRIINIKDGSSVPLGIRGTIIGMKKGDKEIENLYEVLFDEEFPDALSLKGSSACCYRLPSMAFINFSAKQAQQKYNQNNRSSQQRSPSKQNSATQQNDHRMPENKRTQILSPPVSNDFQVAWDRLPSRGEYKKSISVDELFESAQSAQSSQNERPYPMQSSGYNWNAPRQPQPGFRYPNMRPQGPIRNPTHQQVPVRIPYGMQQQGMNNPVVGGGGPIKLLTRDSPGAFQPRMQHDSKSNYTNNPSVQNVNQVNQSTLPFRYPTIVNPLRELCQQTFSQDPSFSSMIIGPMKQNKVTVKLPNGNEFSKYMTDEKDALCDAVLQAMDYLKNMKSQLPHRPPQAAPNTIQQQRFSSCPDKTLSYIPDSFTQQTQQMLNQPFPNFSPVRAPFNPRTPNSQFNGPPRQSKENIFVPKQVRGHLMGKKDSQGVPKQNEELKIDEPKPALEQSLQNLQIGQQAATTEKPQPKQQQQPKQSQPPNERPKPKHRLGANFDIPL